MSTHSGLDDKVLNSVSERFVGILFHQVAEFIEKDTGNKNFVLLIKDQMSKQKFFRILEKTSTIDRIIKEMKSALVEFSGKDLLFVKHLTVEHLIVAMKIYVISSSTLLDVLASLISIVFNLGIADRDISLRLVLNNEHIIKSKIPVIYNRYIQISSIHGLRKTRNLVAHMGKIPDAEVEGLLLDRNRIDARNTLLSNEPISDEDYKNELSKLQKKLVAVAEDKQAIWGKHLAQTVAMLNEISEILANQTLYLWRTDKS